RGACALPAVARRRAAAPSAGPAARRFLLRADRKTPLALRAMRRLGLLTTIALLVAVLAAPAARADEIEVRDVSLRATEEGLVLDADFAFELTPRLADVVANGVPLYFRIEFELTRRGWHWFDEHTPARRLQCV